MRRNLPIRMVAILVVYVLGFGYPSLVLAEPSTVTVERTSGNNHTNTVHLRWMINRDMSEVFNIDSQGSQEKWSEQEFRNLLAQSHTIGMVAEHEGKIVGFCVYQLMRHEIYLAKIVVDPKYPRHEVVTQMIKKFKIKMSENGRNRITLLLSEKDKEGQLFFKAMDFKAVRPQEDESTSEYFMEHRYPSKPENTNIGATDLIQNRNKTESSNEKILPLNFNLKSTNHYECLGVPQNASTAYIRSVYVQLLDRFKDKPSATERIKHAGGILLGPAEKRAQYDRILVKLKQRAEQRVGAPDLAAGDSYAVLGVSRNATLETVEKAWLHSMASHKGEEGKGAREKLSKAYETIRNDQANLEKMAEEKSEVVSEDLASVSDAIDSASGDTAVREKQSPDGNPLADDLYERIASSRKATHEQIVAAGSAARKEYRDEPWAVERIVEAIDILSKPLSKMLYDLLGRIPSKKETALLEGAFKDPADLSCVVPINDRTDYYWKRLIAHKDLALAYLKILKKQIDDEVAKQKEIVDYRSIILTLERFRILSKKNPGYEDLYSEVLVMRADLAETLLTGVVGNSQGAYDTFCKYYGPLSENDLIHKMIRSHPLAEKKAALYPASAGTEAAPVAKAEAASSTLRGDLATEPVALAETQSGFCSRFLGLVKSLNPRSRKGPKG
ncbi:MAG: GNAT family N-acetyltransferase [Deltaproteobacteria bacterium]|nr:GNAT family N-acetyltransferase [Deltaproteobacteria bacterium]